MVRVGVVLLFVGAALLALCWVTPDDAPGGAPSNTPTRLPSAATVVADALSDTPEETGVHFVAQVDPPTPPSPPGMPPTPPVPPLPPSILGERKYQPHSLVKLRAENVDPKAGLLWQVHPESPIQQATTADGLLEFAAPPGQYEIVLLIIVVRPEGGIKVSKAKTTIVVDSCHPPVPPPTPPQPNPPGPNPPSPNPPTPPGGGKLDPSNAIGRIQFGNAGCSATVIAPRRADGRWDVLTAAHCISSVGQTGTMKMPLSGKTFAVRVKAFDRTCDICWLETVDSTADIEYAYLGKDNPPPGTPVWHQGYGFDRPRNREDGTVMQAEDGRGQIRFTLNVSSGDSGGGIFRADTNEVVSSVCCTRSIAAKTDMWGGSTRKAIALRPHASTDEGSRFEPVAPIELPWTPIGIPIRP